MKINLEELAKHGATLGYTLKQIAEYHTLSYPAFKASLKSTGYTHPRGMALHKLRIETAYDCSLDDVIRNLVQDGLGTVETAKALAMDAKTLKTYCAGSGIDLNKNKPIPKHFDNIIAATRSRQRERKDLVWINSASGERKYASEVARELGVSLSTVLRHHEEGLTLEQMRKKEFTAKVDQTVTIGGVTRSFREWCDKNQIQVPTAMKRARAGYSLADAVTLPTCFRSNVIACGENYIDSQGRVVEVQKIDEGFLEDEVLYQGSVLSGRLPKSVFSDRFKRTNEQR